jgi:hypothetical protein
MHPGRLRASALQASKHGCHLLPLIVRHDKNEEEEA